MTDVFTSPNYARTALLNVCGQLRVILLHLPKRLWACSRYPEKTVYQGRSSRSRTHPEIARVTSLHYIPIYHGQYIQSFKGYHSSRKCSPQTPAVALFGGCRLFSKER